MIEKPVFIFCLHRSGSTYLKNIIDRSGQVKMLEDEVHFKHPFFKNTYASLYKKYCNDDIEKYDAFLEYISENRIRGKFWEIYKQNTRSVFSSKDFLTDKKNITIWQSLNSILKQVLNNSGKSRIGIKYPSHHKFYKLFVSEYPDSKPVFLIRDIRAIIASKYVSPTNKRLIESNKFLYEFGRLFTMFYFIFEYNSIIRLIRKYKNEIYVVKYEYLILNKKKEINKLCEYLEIATNEQMFTADGKSTGYNIPVKDEYERLNRWKTILRKYELFLINILTMKSRYSY